MDRRATLLWMRELLLHVRTCQDSLEEARPRQTVRLLQAIDRDLAELRTLCQSLHAELAAPAEDPAEAVP